MLARTSRNKGNHSSIYTKINAYALHHTKADITQLLDDASALYLGNVFDSPRTASTQTQLQLLRQTLHVAHLYRVFLAQGTSNKLLKYEDSGAFISSMLNKNNSASALFTRETITDDVAHVEKIMRRYSIDFFTAFDFWLLSNAMRTDLKYTTNNKARLPDVAGQITFAKLVEVGKKVNLNEVQVRALVPHLETKIAASQTKAVIAKHKAGLFTHSGDFAQELENVVKTKTISLR